MRALIHHPIQRTHRFVDIPAPPPEILTLTVWHGKPLTVKRTAGWPLRVSALSGEWHHEYYRLEPERMGDSYPEYEYVTSRKSHTSYGFPPHVPGVTATPYIRPLAVRLARNERRRQWRLQRQEKV